MGQLGLNLAVAASAAWSAAAGAAAATSGRPRWLLWTRWLAVATVLTSSIAVVVLAGDLLLVDEGSLYVQRFSSERTPLMYRLAGLWGGMEGSLLCWSWLVAVVFLVAARRVPEELRAGWNVVAAATTCSFLIVSKWWASPFERIAIPTGRGAGLPAVLQHPAMLYHPPLLYGGLVLLGVPYALTLVAVWRRRLDATWLTSITPWLRASWAVLGVGMLTGSRWAYAELGWGGFWAWDPVENAALIPWLLTTVALHAATVVRRTGRTAPTTALIVTAAFVCMSVGVYVTRSGGSGSIHAFAESADVGRALVVVAAAHVLIAAAGLVRLRPTQWRWRDMSREAAMLGHVLVLSAITLAIAAATFGPVLVELFGGRRTVIRPEYYAQVLLPLTVVVFVGLALGPSLSWRGGLRDGRRLAAGASAGAVAGVLLIQALPNGSLTVQLFLVAAASAAGAALATGRPRARLSGVRRLGVGAAHAGFAVVMVAAAGSSLGRDTSVFVRLGEVAEVDGETVRLVALDSGERAGHEYVRADVRVGRGPDAPRFRPELRAYDEQRTPTAEASFRGGLLDETVVVMSALDSDARGARFEVLRRPLLPAVWWGALLMLAGGVAAAAAAPRARRRTAPGATRWRSATAARRSAAAIGVDATSTNPHANRPHRAPAPP